MHYSRKVQVFREGIRDVQHCCRLDVGVRERCCEVAGLVGKRCRPARGCFGQGGGEVR
jgi:hypothetical protein